ncbi:hypothetical protein WL241_11515 [Staphylococcus epidermidis]|uniref:hypothetical protein n=1 Tax=Staphylococcus epidermidis TaxID=1282 RepID=UPI00138AE4E9
MSNNKKTNYLSDKVTMWMYGFYVFCTIITSIFIRESDIATLVIPVIFYTVVSIAIRNSNQSATMEKISNDINELLLISFVITYIPIKLNINCIEYFGVKYIGNKILVYIFLFMIIFLVIAIIFLILFFVTKGLSKKFNKESHYHNFENDNKGGSNGGTEQQKEQE